MQLNIEFYCFRIILTDNSSLNGIKSYDSFSLDKWKRKIRGNVVSNPQKRKGKQSTGTSCIERIPRSKLIRKPLARVFFFLLFISLGKQRADKFRDLCKLDLHLMQSSQLLRRRSPFIRSVEHWFNSLKYEYIHIIRFSSYINWYKESL